MLSRHITNLLTVFIILNLLIVMFIALKVGWQQVVDVPTFLYNGIKEPARYLKSCTALADSRLRTTSGIINDANVKLVCSDESFAAAVAAVRPAVVNISCSSIEPSPGPAGVIRFDDPSRDLSALGGIGSGIVVHPRGYILTCHHIVSNASNIYVTPFAPSVRRYRARIIESEENLNLALLKINVDDELPVVQLGDSSEMEVADWVLAIGSPFGLEQSATHGIISDNERDLLIGHRLFRGMMQTDVPINRGSSGGPLINIKGETIGINMAIYSTSGVYNGVSFAMPINQAKPFLATALP
jgi:S1-C subfamily serine protease